LRLGQKWGQPLFLGVGNKKISMFYPYPCHHRVELARFRSRYAYASRRDKRTSCCRSSRRDEEIDIHFVGLRGRKYSAPNLWRRSMDGFHASCVLSCLWHPSRRLWQRSRRLLTYFELKISSPKFQQLARFEAGRWKRGTEAY
jgi:hypothetical protein